MGIMETDPMEIVFMSFLNEGRFDCTAAKWQYNLTGNDIWKEIEDILNTAISAEYLKENDVIQDVIKQGTEIAMELIKEAESSLDEATGNAIDAHISQLNDSTEVTTTTTTTEEYVDVVEMPYYGYDYWDPYYDPYYISPLWLVPAILLF